jgi:hypothetical protein
MAIGKSAAKTALPDSKNDLFPFARVTFTNDRVSHIRQSASREPADG